MTAPNQLLTVQQGDPEHRALLDRFWRKARRCRQCRAVIASPRSTQLYCSDLCNHRNYIARTRKAAQ